MKTTHIVKVHKLDLDFRPDLQPRRVKQAWDFYEAYKNATEEQKKAAGWELPKVYLWHGKYHFVNGNHRAWAQVQMGMTYIECEVE